MKEPNGFNSGFHATRINRKNTSYVSAADCPRKTLPLHQSPGDFRRRLNLR